MEAEVSITEVRERKGAGEEEEGVVGEKGRKRGRETKGVHANVSLRSSCTIHVHGHMR